MPRRTFPMECPAHLFCGPLSGEGEVDAAAVAEFPDEDGPLPLPGFPGEEGLMLLPELPGEERPLPLPGLPGEEGPMLLPELPGEEGPLPPSPSPSKLPEEGENESGSTLSDRTASPGSG